MTSRSPYSDDMSDSEWQLISPVLETKASPRGRRGVNSKREMLNALFYVLRTGCQWRRLPHDLPPWKSVYTQFRRWKHQGIIDRLMDRIRDDLRERLGRLKEPSASIVDSQSVKTTEKGGSKAMTGLKKSTAGSVIHLLAELWVIESFTGFQLPTSLLANLNPHSMSANLDIPLHITIFPGGGSFARPR